jgi:YidC/Oxa1 family membrane protein insertase
VNRRLALAFVLLAIVILVPAILFPPRPAKPGSVGADSLHAAAPIAASAPAVAPSALSALAPSGQASSDADTASTITVRSPLYQYRFSPVGARLTGARMLQYKTFAVGDTGAAQLIPDGSEYLAYQLVVGSDTVSLADWVFVPSSRDVTIGAEGGSVDWTATRGGVSVNLRYRFEADTYLFHVSGQITGLGGAGGLVLVGLGPGIRTVEADSVLDFGARGVVTKAAKTENLSFGSLQPGERQVLTGPFEWTAIKSKYFVAAVLTIDTGAPRLGGAVAIGGARSGKNAVGVHVLASLPAPEGRFSHAVYVGPQEYRNLSRIGHDFEDVNPYGWSFIRPIIHPVSIWIFELMLWVHEHLNLAYGWVLILFGLVVRAVMWPLQQKAMRSQMAMQAMQPELKAVQDRHKNDPQKLQQEMMRLYKEYNVNPLGGCLPMLLPMPVLFALFFVFNNTIELRGAPFLWLTDLSRADPLFIIPLVMGLSMFAVSKLGQMGVPPNPQTQTMVYVMPVMFTVLFLRLSSGLNMYYAVSNIATIPQQWLIARERLKKAGRPPG